MKKKRIVEKYRTRKSRAGRKRQRRGRQSEGKRRRRRFSPTPFDDAFKTLITGPSEIVIPFLNEMFPDKEPIPDNAILEQERNEFLINLPEQSDGSGEIPGTEKQPSRKRQKKVITDSNLRYGNRCFHLECQSSPDGTMLIRMFEYDAQIALSHGKFRDGVLDVFFPESGVLYVRESGSVPEKLKIRIHTSGTDAEYEVKVLRMRNYRAEDLFGKRLFLLLPFLICNEERNLSEVEKDGDLVEKFCDQFAGLIEKLNETKEKGILTDYGYATVVETMKAVSAYVTRRYPKVEKEVSNIMGGKVIDYEARHIFNAGEVSGFAKGEVKGESNGGLRMLCELVAGGDLPVETAVEKAKAYGVKNEGDFRKRALLLNIEIKK